MPRFRCMVVNGAISDRNIFRHSVFVQVKCLQATNTKKYLLLKPHRLPYHVYMLKIGSEVIIDKSSQYPEPWAQEPYDLMWGDTNIGIMTLDELGALKTAVNDEIKLNHSTDSDINHFVQLLTKNRVEQYLLAQGLEASWPWTSYEYVRDWDMVGSLLPVSGRMEILISSTG